MGDKSLAFVRKARDYTANNPDMVPRFLDLQMFEADLRAARFQRDVPGIPASRK